MNISTDIQLPDMNIPDNLEFYRQIVVFENDIARERIEFNSLDHPQQRAVQSIAHSRNLEYEYQLGRAKVFRGVAIEPIPSLSNQSDRRATSVHGNSLLANATNSSPTRLVDIHKPLLPTSLPNSDNASLPNVFPRTLPDDPQQETTTNQATSIYFMSQATCNSTTQIETDSLQDQDHSDIWPLPNLNPSRDQYYSLSELMGWNDALPSATSEKHSSITGSLPPDLNSSGHQYDSLWTESMGWNDALPSATSDKHSSITGSLPQLTPYAFGVNSRSNSLMSSKPISPIASPRVMPANEYELGHDTNSRSSSVNSAQSERYLMMSTKRKEIGSSWSMNSTKRSKRASSGGSGRSGPLDYLARLGMKAVKAVGGACWRCKILGKKCTEESPCETCPKRNKPGKATWSSIGCKRGSLGEEMQLVTLCPFYNERPSKVKTDRVITERVVRRCQCQYYWCEDHSGGICPRCTNCHVEIMGSLGQVDRGPCLEAIRERREKDIEATSESPTGNEDLTVLNQVLLKLRKNPLLEDLGLTAHRSTTPHHSSAPLIPLDQCLMAIIWELAHDSSHFSHLSLFEKGTKVSDSDSLGSLIILLRSAALYQARLENDPHQLIAQSLICLRDVLETKRAVSFGAFSEFLHFGCYPSRPLCYDRNIKDLTPSLMRYTDQLSLVFFKKENLRSRNWWLSVFYSLVIQSAVRTVLITIMDDAGISVPPSIKQYLHLALRLFIATSGDFDPLTHASSKSDFQTFQSEMLENESYETAKFSVQQENWESIGLASSGEYLCQLFEDNGLPIVPKVEAKLADHSSLLMPLSGLLECNIHSHGVEGVDLSYDKLSGVGETNVRNAESSAFSRQMKQTSGDINGSARSHPLYHNVLPGPDGLYHCPWEGQSNCLHKPEKLKINYDKFVDSHLKPYRCKIPACEGLAFSSTACLLRHERETHAMHGRGNKPYLCTHEGCERAAENNGFPRHWNLRDHMRRVHNADILKQGQHLGSPKLKRKEAS